MLLYQGGMRYVTLSLCLLGVLILGAAPLTAADAPPFNVGEFTFNRPANWEWVQVNSSMRKAQFKIQDAAKRETAEVVFFYFGEGGGGSTQANVDRWLGQFAEPKEKLNSRIEAVNVGGHKVTYVQAEGTYQSGMPGGQKTPQPNSMLFGGIIESDHGNIFIRLTGPAALAKASQKEFRKMVEDALAKK